MHSSAQLVQTTSPLGTAGPKAPVDSSQAQAERHLLGILRRFGYNVTSFQILKSNVSYWFDGPDACVAYVDTGRAWVVAGAPVADASRVASVAKRFHEQARAARRRVVFVSTEARFRDATEFPSLAIGQQPEWDPTEWEGVVRHSRSLREQLRRAKRKQVMVRPLHADELSSSDAPIRRSIEQLMRHWHAAHSLPPLGFLANSEPFRLAQERRLFVALRGKQVVGFAGLSPIFAKNGWLVEDLFRTPDAPNGTVELLVDAAMRDARSLGCSYVTLGASPLVGATAPWLRWVGRCGSVAFDFRGLFAFKSKFRPRAWSPIYLTYPPGCSPIVAVFDCLVAFVPTPRLRFGISAVRRNPRLLVGLLAVPLVPWTLLLSQVDAERWFHTVQLKWFWLAFDTILFLALLAASIWQKRRVVDLALRLVVFDAAATAVHVACWDYRRATSALELSVLLVALAAPLFASWVLLSFRRKLSS